MSEAPYYVTCPECGSPNVTRDCIGRWDFEKQEWVVSGELDNMDCDDCGHDGHSFETTPVEELTPEQRATIFTADDYVNPEAPADA